VQQQIWGEVVDFNLAFFQFIWQCNSKNIIKIGPYLPKLLQEKFGAVFLAHPVDATYNPWTMCRKDLDSAQNTLTYIMYSHRALTMADGN